MFDTPPESVIVGRLIELQLPEGADEAEGEPRLRDRKPVNILFR
jgi:hypothetical protein